MGLPGRPLLARILLLVFFPVISLYLVHTFKQ